MPSLDLQCGTLSQDTCSPRSATLPGFAGLLPITHLSTKCSDTRMGWECPSSLSTGHRLVRHSWVYQPKCSHTCRSRTLALHWQRHGGLSLTS